MLTSTYKSNVKTFLTKYDFVKKKALNEIGEVGLTSIKRETPVITGRLRDGNEVKVDENNVYWINDVEYGPFVHNGTSRQAAQPFMRAGITKERRRFLAILLRNLKV